MLTGLLPQCVLITDGKTHDRRAVQDLHFEADDLLIFDRAYLDYAWLYQLHQDGVWFVTRLKSNSCYEVIQARTASGAVLADQIIRLSSPQGQACYPELLRRVHYRDPETGQEYVLLTNRLDLSALEVAELYRRRWQIGASRQGRVIQSVKVRPRLTDSRPRSLEGAVARKQDGKALRQPSSKGGRGNAPGCNVQ